MFKELLQLVVLLTVIFDPPASFVVFFSATKDMISIEKKRIAALSIFIAALISFIVLFAGPKVLVLFNTSIENFKVAGGIILGILGIKMALGHSLTNVEKMKPDSARAIAAIIGTPLLTGPAAITAILISRNDYGLFLTGLAIFIVLLCIGILFYQASRIHRFVGKTAIQVISTIFGLVTLAWGVMFIRTGLGI